MPCEARKSSILDDPFALAALDKANELDATLATMRADTGGRIRAAEEAVLDMLEALGYVMDEDFGYCGGNALKPIGKQGEIT